MESKPLKNKVAVVSGSSMGIGKAIAIELAILGAQVVLNGRDFERLYNSENDLKRMGYDVRAFIADIHYPDQCAHLINEAVKAYGKIDILVNNAALSSRGSVEKMVTTNIKALIETNYMGSAYLSKYAIPHLGETKGHLIFINSAGGFRGMPFNVAYSASKIAQSALADALRIELYDSGIHVGIAYVGFTENDPKKTILDVDGSLIYLPKRLNLQLAKPQSVARSVCRMIIKRKNKITLTRLGHFANFSIRYLPLISNWILWLNRRKIEKQFTLIGGLKVVQNKK